MITKTEGVRFDIPPGVKTMEMLMVEELIRMLDKIQEQMNEEHIDVSLFNANALNMTESRWHGTMQTLNDEGFIEGYEIDSGYDVQKIRITLKGLECLRDNKI